MMSRAGVGPPGARQGPPRPARSVGSGLSHPHSKLCTVTLSGDLGSTDFSGASPGSGFQVLLASGAGPHVTTDIGHGVSKPPLGWGGAPTGALQGFSGCLGTGGFVPSSDDRMRMFQ